MSESSAGSSAVLPGDAAGANGAAAAPGGPQVRNSNSMWPWVEPDSRFSVTGNLLGCKEWPRITLVTPNYNYEYMLERTIRGIVMQGYPNLEYIVIDDGSSDGSVEVIKKYQKYLAHWETHPNMGQYKTINKGMAMATGEVVGWLNSDDTYLPWTLWWVGAIFAKYPEIQWITGGYCGFQDATIHNVSKISPIPQELIRNGLFYGGKGGMGWICQEATFWRRSLWEKAGPLRPELTIAADYELWVRFAELTPLWRVSTLLGGPELRPAGANRSITMRERYMKEIDIVLKELKAKGRTLADVNLYDKVRRIPVIGGLTRRALRLGKYKGPVLVWDYPSASYKKTEMGFFPYML